MTRRVACRLCSSQTLELCEDPHACDLCICNSYTSYMFRHTRLFFKNVYAVSHLKSIKINPALAPMISQVFLNTDEQNSFYGKWRTTHSKERMERGTRFVLICLSLAGPPTLQIHLNSFQAGKWKRGSCPLFQRRRQRPGNSAIFYHQG